MWLAVFSSSRFFVQVLEIGKAYLFEIFDRQIKCVWIGIYLDSAFKNNTNMV